MPEEIVQKKKEWNYLKALSPLFLISLLSCGMSLYYLSLNPDHVLVFDDSYITLKFASNFFKFGGITYDGTSYFSGATSPLHIVFIALLGLFLEIETASLVVGIAFFIFSSLLVYLWAFRIYEDRKIALLAGVMMSTSGWVIFDSLSGLETTTFMFFSLLTLYTFSIHENRLLYITPLFLSVLTRPEGWFIACSIWGWQFIQAVYHKDSSIFKRMVTSWIFFSMLMIPYLLLHLKATGSFLPNTAFAKAIFFGEGYLTLPRKGEFFKDGVELFYKKLLYPAPILIVPLILFSRKLISMPYLWFYCIMFYAVYLLTFPGATGHYWCRYQHIFIPIIIIAISSGAFELLKKCKKKASRISMVALIISSLVYNQSVSFVSAENTYSGATNCTKRSLLNLALWLNRHTHKDSLIALHDIGAVGYFSDRGVLDLVGLVNPEVSKYYRDKHLEGALPLSKRRVIDYLKVKEPNYLVLFPGWDRYFNFFRPDNKKHFKQVYTSRPLFPTGVRYKVFKCNWEL